MRQMDKVFCFFFISNKSIDTLRIWEEGDIESIIKAGKDCLKITNDEDATLKWYKFAE